MISGKPLIAEAAKDIGLIDQVVNGAENIKPAIKSWLEAQNQKKPERKQRETETDQSALEICREKFLRRVRVEHTPAPFAIIEHLRRYEARFFTCRTKYCSSYSWLSDRRDTGWAKPDTRSRDTKRH